MVGMARCFLGSEGKSFEMESTPHGGYSPSEFWRYMGMADRAINKLKVLRKGSREVGLKAAAVYAGRVVPEGLQEDFAEKVVREFAAAKTRDWDFRAGTNVQRLVANVYLGFTGAANELFNSENNGGSLTDWQVDLKRLIDFGGDVQDLSTERSGKRSIDNVERFRREYDRRHNLLTLT